MVIINLCPIIDPAVWTSLQQRFQRRVVPGVILDVYDGQAYKKHAAFLANPANISLVCNTDGVALFTSSTVEIWPVWLSSNELPRHERWAIILLYRVLTLGAICICNHQIYFQQISKEEHDSWSFMVFQGQAYYDNILKASYG